MKITLIKTLGTDLTIVNAARVSLNKQSKKINEQDEKLIAYLMKHKHWSPFAHAILQYRITAPLFIARQWYKHQIGIARNEISRRYISTPPTYYTPQTWRQTAKTIKQGSAQPLPQEKQKEIHQKYKNHIKDTTKLYKELINNNICPEQARIILPQATNTQWIETASLYACLRIIHLRCEHTAQKEIQKLAQQLEKIIKQKYPITMKTYKTHGI